ncbi:unnamed protein product [Owenia fusiformis]|uniref:Transmembrane protein 168 n=1 Tax=Owenia fusiformis TaxID=6347 RepID=A0A8S4NRC8_OWEFU|nr:unnamed protein product [Owenia fusiformis]
MFRGLLAVRYHIIHVPTYCQDLIKVRLPLFWTRLLNMKRETLVRYIGYLSNFVLLAAICLGLNTRYVYTQDVWILVVGIMALFLFAISAALSYYFSFELLGFSLARLWVGCLLGILAFAHSENISHDTMEDLMTGLLIGSVVVRSIMNIVERLLHIPNEHGMLPDFMEMLGLAIGSLIIIGNNFVPISLLVCAFAFTVVAIQLKSYLGFLNLVGLISIVQFLFFPKLLKIPVNHVALYTFMTRLAFQPVLDLLFSSQTTLESWERFFSQSSFLRRINIFGVIILELILVGFYAKQIPNHKEWFIVVPIFIVFTLIWLCFHLVYLITMWQLMNKITECNATFEHSQEEGKSLTQIMASKGVRHFSLISQRLVFFTIVSTILVFVIGWTEKTSISVALFLMVLPIECVTLSLLWELGSILGGMCVGYALVAPSTYKRSDANATVLQTTIMQELGAISTRILNVVQRFFTFHYIDTYGCDYCSSGLTLESVETKLKSFLERCTSDGPRFDTYVVYYSGETMENGDWALAGDNSLNLDTLLEWWREKDGGSGSRLVLILDTWHSHQWLRPVRRIKDCYVALQTSIISKYADEETVSATNIGDFTKEFMYFNCENEAEIDFTEKNRVIRALYTVSRSWTDFMFHLPTEEDITNHWNSNFPKLTRPLIKATNLPGLSSLCCCCDCVFRCLRRKKMRWLPPNELDTGHGFKLVRS